MTQVSWVSPPNHSYSLGSTISIWPSIEPTWYKTQKALNYEGKKAADLLEKIKPVMIEAFSQTPQNIYAFNPV